MKAKIMGAVAANAILGAVLAAGAAQAADAERAEFGRLPDGTAIEAVTLSNGSGVSARIITYGATLQSLVAPDARGQGADIVLGHDTLDGYVQTPQYFGVTVGRYANRIAGAAFELDGQRYALAANNGPNALHGGVQGFDKVVWAIESVESGPTASVTFKRVSPHGEEGYPGELTVRVTYALDERNALTIRYEATTDRATVVNLTNHSFFNLGGAVDGGDVMGHRLTIPAETYTPVDATLIPTGEFRPVAGTPFDFRTPQTVGARIRDGRDEQLRRGQGYDHNYVLAREASAQPRLAARLEDPASGRVLELLTTEPGVQFYSGNFLDGSVVGKGDRVYRQGDGLCLEPQKFPDTPNQPAFPSARLDPGQTYRHVSVFRLSTTR